MDSLKGNIRPIPCNTRDKRLHIALTTRLPAKLPVRLHFCLPACKSDGPSVCVLVACLPVYLPVLFVCLSPFIQTIPTLNDPDVKKKIHVCLKTDDGKGENTPFPPTFSTSEINTSMLKVLCRLLSSNAFDWNKAIILSFDKQFNMTSSG